jgi:hypothetical protein
MCLCRCDVVVLFSYSSHHPLIDDAYLTVGSVAVGRAVASLHHAGMAVRGAAAEAAHEATAGGLGVVDLLLGALLAAAAEPKAEAGGEEEDDAANDDADEGAAGETPATAALTSGLAGDDGGVLNDGSDRVHGDVELDLWKRVWGFER